MRRCSKHARAGLPVLWRAASRDTTLLAYSRTVIERGRVKEPVELCLQPLDSGTRDESIVLETDVRGSSTRVEPVFC